jgi:hypothetical protein
MDKQTLEHFEKELRDILPDGWEDKFETHEDLYGLFERSYDRAETIAWALIAALRMYVK